MAHTSNPSSKEAEAGGSLQTEFQDLGLLLRALDSASKNQN